MDHQLATRKREITAEITQAQTRKQMFRRLHAAAVAEVKQLQAKKRMYCALYAYAKTLGLRSLPMGELTILEPVLDRIVHNLDLISYMNLRATCKQAARTTRWSGLRSDDPTLRKIYDYCVDDAALSLQLSLALNGTNNTNHANCRCEYGRHSQIHTVGNARIVHLRTPTQNYSFIVLDKEVYTNTNYPACNIWSGPKDIEIISIGGGKCHALTITDKDGNLEHSQIIHNCTDLVGVVGYLCGL